jgi:hypothetical protein
MQEKADELLDATPELPDDTPLDRSASQRAFKRF